jgi:hypothetical protein
LAVIGRMARIASTRCWLGATRAVNCYSPVSHAELEALLRDYPVFASYKRLRHGAKAHSSRAAARS